MAKNCFDCKIAFKAGLCKSNCCGCVPIDLDLYNKHLDKINKPVEQLLDWGQGIAIPLTANGMCCFLQDNGQCGIYEDRPSVCKEFGTTERNIHLACPYLKPSGAIRSEASKKKIERLQNTATQNIFNRFK